MARSGRKRAVKPRHPGGRVIGERPDQIVGTVLAQPHRRGDRDQLCASALGRACRRARLRRECYDAGEDYAALVRRWRAAKGAPSDLRLGGAGGEGPDQATVDRWRRTILECDGAMARESREGWIAARAAMLDEIDVDMTWQEAFVCAMLGLAVCMGKLPAGALKAG